MSFQPQVPLAGIAGWRFLERTQPAQQAAFEKGPQLAREIAYFEENIGKVETAAELVADRRLLKVALGAFGLGDEIDKKAFIRKILEEGTADRSALAMRLTEPAYREMSAAFGFGDAGGRRNGEPGFAPKIVAAYKTRAFESAVGETSNDMRLAMNFKREIGRLAEGEGASLFKVIGSKPMRQVFEKAFNLPSQFVQLDIDKQAQIFGDKLSRMFGRDDLTVFQDPANVDKLITRFLAISQIETGAAATSPASGALTLLQNASGGGSQGLFNLLAARG